MQENFVGYEIALKLKELGFNEPCLAYYNICNNLKGGYRIRYIEHEDSNPSKQCINKNFTFCLAPLYQQVLKWLREIHNIDITVYPIEMSHNERVLEQSDIEYSYKIHSKGVQSFLKHLGKQDFNTYEESLEYALILALSLIKN